MDLHPLDRSCKDVTIRIAGIIFFHRVPSCIFIQHLYLLCTINYLALSRFQRMFSFPAVRIDLLVAVHTYVSGRYHSLAALFSAGVAVKTVDLVNARMYFM